MRRTVVAKTTAVQDFVCDDGIIDGAPPTATEQRPLLLIDPDGETEGAPAAAAGARPRDSAPTEEVFAPTTPAVESHPEAAPLSWRILSPSFWLLCTALLLTGLFFFVVQSENIGPGPFAQWKSGGTEKAAPEATGDDDAAAFPSAVASPSAVANIERIVVPPVPKPSPTRAAPVALPVAPPPAPPQNPVPVVESAAVPVMAAPLENDEEDAWFSLAEEYRQVRDLDRAEELYRRIISEGTQRGRAALALGDMYLGKGDSRRARELYVLSERLYRDAGPLTSLH